MIDNVKQHFMLAVQHSLEQVFDAEELAEGTMLEANVGPVHRAFILVYDESAQPTQPCVPVPTIKLHEGGEVYFVYLLAEVEARGGEVAGEIVLRHPLEIAQNRPVEASAHWDQYERCQDNFRRLTGAKRLTDSFPNPLLGYTDVLGGCNRSFYPGDLVSAYCAIANFNKVSSPAKAGKARGAQRKREVERGTIPAIELAIESLREEGRKPTQKAVAERSGFGIATVKRHWNHVRIVKARTCD
ncbi:hypothetical protein [Pseudodesulfovibrio karagichevae]|uniref:Uncharacterized protein n=1 Tax=Pseudodesulfovibrio karagichevae TaxID=3239305 RepID=A0ABV4JXY3_9BACT